MDQFWLISMVAGILTLIAVIVSKIYFKMTIGMCESPERMDNKIIIITGGNTGIGKETARELAARGGKIILGVRNQVTGNEAVIDIIQSTGNSDVSCIPCDLSSFKSVKGFCDIVKSSIPHLDALVLNAGMVPPPGKFITEDGNELQLQVNHLSHFLMVNLLMDKLKASPAARIVCVSSMLHHWGNIDFENLRFENYTPDPFFTYSMSKLCSILMCTELTCRLQGTNITANSLHPGLVKTSINRQTPWYVKHVFQNITKFWAKSSREGAQTSIYLTVSSEVSGLSGKYFTECSQMDPHPRALDQDLSFQLWERSLQLVGLLDQYRY